MRLLRPLFLLACLIPAVASAQAVLDWAKDDGDGGNTYGPLNGKWSTTDGYWVDDADFLSLGSPDVWVNGSIAYFVGPANSYTAVVSENLTLAGLKSGSPNLVIDNGDSYTLTLTGAAPVFDLYYDANVLNVPLAGTNGLTVTGGGGLAINTANPGLSGPVFIQHGIVHANDAAALGSGTVTLGDADYSGRLSFDSPSGIGAFDYTVANPITFANGSSRLEVKPDTTNWSLRTVTLTGAVTLNANGTLDGGTDEGYLGSNSALTVNGAIGGTGGLTVNGDVTLAGANTFTGNLLVGQQVDGRVRVGNFNNENTDGPLGHNTGLVLGSQFGEGGTSAGEVYYTGGTATSDRTIQINGEYGLLNVGNAATTLTLTGVISGSAGWSSHDFIKDGAGTLRLTGNNTFAGETYLTNGTLIAGHNNALGSDYVEVGYDADYNSNLKLLLENGVTLGIPVDIGNGNNDGGSTTLGLSGTGAATFDNEVYLERGIVVDVGSGGTLTFADYVSDGNGGGSIRKNGAGTVVFSSTVDLRGGGLTIHEGKAVLDSAGTTSLTGGLIVHSNGSFLLGSSAASTLTVPTLYLGGGNWTWKLAGLSTADTAQFDRLVVNTGTPEGTNYNYLEIEPGSTLTLDLSLLGISSRPANGTAVLNDPFWQASEIWKLVTFTGTGSTSLTPGDANPFTLTNGVWAGGVFDTFVGGGAGDFAGFTSGDVYLRFSPVPEPSTYALLGLGGLMTGLGWLRRRRA